jgi:hypothetical protein
MRALCGAIIAAGASIGLGITALGIGQRYAGYREVLDGQHVLIRLSQVDGPLIFVLVFLTCTAIVGLGIAFLGLAYHHHRREREHLLHRTSSGTR